MKEYLDKASKAYYEGCPIMSDAQFDKLAESFGYSDVGAKPSNNLKKHLFRMYSLNKHYASEGNEPLLEFGAGEKIKTIKLDGAAISLLYANGELVQALTRGDGIEGTDILDKIKYKQLVPLTLPITDVVQITGEVVAPKTIENSRNYASGALNLKDLEEFLTRDLEFIAYGCESETFSSTRWTDYMSHLNTFGFSTVYTTHDVFLENFPSDGYVIRVDNIAKFQELGFTAKFPRGAYALKERTEAVETTLLDVVWQVGKSGKVTPVAILEGVYIGDALIGRATLNNQAYIEALGLTIGCKVGVVRAGEIIPQVVYKA